VSDPGLRRAGLEELGGRCLAAWPAQQAQELLARLGLQQGNGGAAQLQQGSDAAAIRRAHCCWACEQGTWRLVVAGLTVVCSSFEVARACGKSLWQELSSPGGGKHLSTAPAAATMHVCPVYCKPTM
jgi:hypothetical protein